MGNACQASDKPKKNPEPVEILNSIHVHKKVIEKKTLSKNFDKMGVSLAYSNQGDGNSIQNSVTYNTPNEHHFDIVENQQSKPGKLPQSLTAREKELQFFVTMKPTPYHRVLKQIMEFTVKKSSLNRLGSTELDTPATVNLQFQERKINKICSGFDLLELFLSSHNIKLLVYGEEPSKEDEKSRNSPGAVYSLDLTALQLIGFSFNSNIFSIKMTDQNFYYQLSKNTSLLDKTLRELETIIWSSAGRLASCKKGWFELIWYKLKSELNLSTFQFFIPEIIAEKSNQLCKTLEESLKKRFASILKEVSFESPLEYCTMEKEQIERLKLTQIHRSSKWNFFSVGESVSITDKSKEMYMIIPKQENWDLGNMTASQTEARKVGLVLFENLNDIPHHLLGRVGLEDLEFYIIIALIVPQTSLQARNSDDFQYYIVDNILDTHLVGIYYRLAVD